MGLTYRQLLERCKQLPEEHLDDTVTVYDAYAEEFYPVDEIRQSCPSDATGDILDPAHAYLVLFSGPANEDDD